MTSCCSRGPRTRPGRRARSSRPRWSVPRSSIRRSRSTRVSDPTGSPRSDVCHIGASRSPFRRIAPRPDWTLPPRRDGYRDDMATAYWHPFADMGAVSHAELLIERGEGVHVFDADGRRYLDGTASLWYANLGHGRKDVTRAVAGQMDRLAAYQTFGDFSNRPANELAARLAALAPMEDAKVFLASGGGDAIETAAKIARRHWALQGRPERVHILSRTNAYHGTHGYGTAIGGIEANVSNWGPLIPHVSAVPHD